MAEGHNNWNESGMNSQMAQLSMNGAIGPYTALLGSPYDADASQLAPAPYRWTPCTEWDQTGRCKYNENCYRRHGPDDPRIVPQGWGKKRQGRSSSQSSTPHLANAGMNSLAGSFSNGGNSTRAPRMPSNRTTAPNSRSNLTFNGPSSSASASLSSLSQVQGTATYQSQSASYPSLSSLTGIMSPDSYDSDPATSPPIMSPTIMSPLLTSPTLSHRVSLNSSPRESLDHQHGVALVVEKPWIWQPCRHWQESGTCRYGESCKYRHGPEDRRERPAPRPSGHTHPAHLMRSTSNSSMDSMSTYSTNDSLLHSVRPNISLQPGGTQITSPSASMGSLPVYNASAGGVLAALGHPSGGNNVIWDMFSSSSSSNNVSMTNGNGSPPLGENANGVMQNFSDHIRNLCLNFPEPAELATELNSLHIQAMIAVQLQREQFLPLTVQEPMRALLQTIAISSNPNEWRYALIRVQDVLTALLDHLFNKFVSVSISSPSSSFGSLPTDVPTKLSLIQPYIGGRLSGSITELYDLGQRAASSQFFPSQEEVITILEQIRRIAASTSKTV